MLPTAQNRNLPKIKSAELDDLQSQPDDRAIAIDKVGIRGLEAPIQLRDRDGHVQETVAQFNMFVGLAHNVRGAHMSRFVEVLNAHAQAFSVENIAGILRTMQTRLGAQSAYLEMAFPFFLWKTAPVTKQPGRLNYQVRLLAARIREKLEITLEVRVPVKTLCPCSKSISKYGAHNQRGLVAVQIRSRATVWIQCLIEIVEASASSGLYTLLKRPDEKHVTEAAYENPVFVEDLARNIVLRLQKDERIAWYQVEAENQESIHNHNAYALIRRSKPENGKNSRPGAD